VEVLLNLEKQAENLIINIGAGEDYSIREFAQKICAVLEYDFSRIDFDHSKYVGAKSKLLRVDRLKELYPSFKPRSLDQGLKTTIQWFQDAKANFV
jgi:GDP-L-fucose synthase